VIARFAADQRLTVGSQKPEAQTLVESREGWQDLVRQTAAYLEVLRDGGFCCAEGKFEPALPDAPPETGTKMPSRRRKTRTQRPSPETREVLKAALSDPYANLVAPGRKAPAAPKAAPLGQAAPAKGAPAVALRDPAKGAQQIASAKTLDELRRLVAGCYMCSLAPGRTQTVFGVGNTQTDLVFVGEAPGYHEDIQGKPFVGRAGALLTDMIRAMGFEREDVFICNIIKCRPPGNRDPRPDEMKACEPFLKRQIELIKPKVICALGRYAIQSLLRDTTPISKLRGKWRTYHGIALMPTFHPAYLLRNDSQKRNAWEDLKAVMAKLAED